MSRKIAIYGSGLGAAFVLAAVRELGFQPEIITDKPIQNNQNLGHVLVRDIPEYLKGKLEPERVCFFSMGTKDTYLSRMKRLEDRKSSKTAFPVDGRSELWVYNPNDVLSALLPPWTEHIVVGKVTDEQIEKASKSYLWSFVTFPLQISLKKEKFVFYWSKTSKQHRYDLPNFAIYNGTMEKPWTRYTCYWGIERWEFSHLEFPTQEFPPMPDAVKIPDIAPGIKEFVSFIPHVTLVGRYARWNKSILVHEAYEQTKKILQTL